MVHDSERRALRDRGASGQILEQDREVQRHEHHRLRLIFLVEHRVAEVDCALAGDAADLVVADGEVARRQRLAEIRPVGDIDAALQR